MVANLCFEEEEKIKKKILRIFVTGWFFKDEGEEPPSAWTHSPKLISFDLMYIDLPKIYQVRSDANWFLFGKFLTL